MKKISYILTGVLAGFIALSLMALNAPNNQPLGGIPNEEYSFGSFATSGVITLSAGNQSLILATSSARGFAQFSSTCTSPVFLRFAVGSAGVANVPATGGFPIHASSSYFIERGANLYTGPVFASSSAACTVSVSESQ